LSICERTKQEWNVLFFESRREEMACVGGRKLAERLKNSWQGQEKSAPICFAKRAKNVDDPGCV
jgi:hypothetical protein